MSELRGARIHVTGTVQGVGFRPFVFGLARRLHLSGWVRNTSAGVEIEADGTAGALADFLRALQFERPPLAQVESITVAERPADGYADFTILASQPVAGAFQPISPDVTICPECLRELFDPADRRYRYPFINCTHCGPRFTIIRDIPYDRPLTTMAPFAMCPACAAEYADPLDRRFHAQPVACPACGPHVWLETAGAPTPISEGDAAIAATRALLAAGRILAIRGLGGFHLACDATDEAAVAELRRRKRRVAKPFAVMLPDVAAVARHGRLSPAEQALLESRERPIVILDRRPGSAIAAVAPGQATIGAMLPYTPLHHLLLEPAAGFPDALVMTSGNWSEEPIVTANDEARDRLAGLADAFLLHDRDIHVRCDDSVVRAARPSGRPLLLRRARGYAPAPLELPFEVPPVLATGAELKNTFCLARGRHAFLSHHIGDLENYETLRAFEDGVAHFERLFRVRPALIAYDAHPDYLASRYALARAAEEDIPAVAVQHHHAHIAACLAEHGLPGDRPVIGVAFDGTGYGADGRIWGGEFLVAGYVGYERPCHLAYAPLPGGDAAAREPWRMALAWLRQAGLAWEDDLPPVRFALETQSPAALALVGRQLDLGLNAPLTSSAGRLFDAVAALVGVGETITYEAQAAIELEALVDPDEPGAYPLALGEGILDPAPLIAAVVADWRAGIAPGRIAARFHNGLAQGVVAVCREIAAREGLREVALSGGVWQNVTLLARTLPLLEAAGFTVYQHSRVPANDGGLALGQLLIAAAQQPPASREPAGNAGENHVSGRSRQDR